MKKFLLFLLGMLITLPAVAFEFKYEYKGQSLTYTVIDEEAKTVEVKYKTLTGYPITGSVIIPDKVQYESEEYTVTALGNAAFRGQSKLTEVTIPNSVTSIGDQAFMNCGLTEVTIPEFITSIGDQAFSGCELTEVTIPESVKEIGAGAFYCYSRSLTKAMFASFESLCSIYFASDDANPLFYAHNLYINGTEITKVELPNSITSIGRHAFTGCSMTEVILPESVKEIGEHAFADCSDLTKVTLNSVISIGNGAFQDCTSMTEVTLPESLKEIGEGAFFGTHITELTIPTSLTEIGECAFSYMDVLRKVTIPESVTKIGDRAFMRCISLREIKIPHSVTEIGESIFFGIDFFRLLDLTQARPSIYTAFESQMPETTLIFAPKDATVTEGRANVVVDGQCEHFVIQYFDYQRFLKVPYEFTAQKVTINRYFGKDYPYTLYLPFEIDSKDYGTFYTGGSFNSDNNTVSFSKLEDPQTTANTPYMFQPNKNFPDGITISDVTVKMTTEDVEKDGLNGVYEERQFTSDEVAQKIYYGWGYGEFRWAELDAVVDACRAYFKLPISAAAKAPARLTVKLGDDDATDIRNIYHDDSDYDSPIYNLNGQRVDENYRGIVVKNGSKTLRISH